MFEVEESKEKVWPRAKRHLGDFLADAAAWLFMWIVRPFAIALSFILRLVAD